MNDAVKLIILIIIIIFLCILSFIDFFYVITFNFIHFI